MWQVLPPAPALQLPHRLVGQGTSFDRQGGRRLADINSSRTCHSPYRHTSLECDYAVWVTGNSVGVNYIVQ